MDNKIYWIWLQQCIGYGSKKIKEVISLYSSVKEFYDSGLNAWKLCGCFTNKDLNLMSSYSLEDANKIILRCKELGQTIITYEDNCYPKLLRQICDPPCVLYVKGELPELNNKLCIAIIGTRSATESGLKTSFKFGFDLAKANVVVVSGGALGIDSSAHKGAISAEGKTVCVLSSGINYNYLVSNASLRKMISENGAIISEYAPDTPVRKWSFHCRNRIVSGLCRGVVVIEAGERSGSLITVNLALEQNKDVFSIPGDLRSAVSIGTNNLIKMGAKPVTCIEDILEDYIHEFSNIKFNEDNKYLANNIANYSYDTNNKKNYTYNEIKFTEDEKKELPEYISQNARKLYNLLTKDPIHIDVLSEKMNAHTSVVLQSITELEINDLILSHSGKRYSIK